MLSKGDPILPLAGVENVTKALIWKGAPSEPKLSFAKTAITLLVEFTSTLKASLTAVGTSVASALTVIVTVAVAASPVASVIE